jgi:hypothetical protein
MRNISTAVRGHYDDDRYMWAIIIRRFYDNSARERNGISLPDYETNERLSLVLDN